MSGADQIHFPGLYNQFQARYDRRLIVVMKEALRYRRPKGCYYRMQDDVEIEAHAEWNPTTKISKKQKNQTNL
jgi:hypothetical protein